MLMEKPMRLRHAVKHLALTAVVASAGLAHAQSVKVDITVPEYKPTSGVSGSLSSIGSDTLNNLMTLWQESFRNSYPNVRVQVEGKRSSTPPTSRGSGDASQEADGVPCALGFAPPPGATWGVL
jgi:phosphate transport system substrate-binding protein